MKIHFCKICISFFGFLFLAITSFYSNDPWQTFWIGAGSIGTVITIGFFVYQDYRNKEYQKYRDLIEDLERIEKFLDFHFFSTRAEHIVHMMSIRRRFDLFLYNLSLKEIKKYKSYEVFINYYNNFKRNLEMYDGEKKNELNDIFKLSILEEFYQKAKSIENDQTN